ncbi:MAG: hypothetical protein K0S07_1245 [Chlamydiales bacterium]|jgi:hypothetical protein|nr:hypothetical protein [Chlamydiales bacterium]
MMGEIRGKKAETAAEFETFMKGFAGVEQQTHVRLKVAKRGHEASLTKVVKGWRGRLWEKLSFGRKREMEQAASFLNSYLKNNQEYLKFSAEEKPDLTKVEQSLKSLTAYFTIEPQANEKVLKQIEKMVKTIGKTNQKIKKREEKLTPIPIAQHPPSMNHLHAIKERQKHMDAILRCKDGEVSSAKLILSQLAYFDNSLRDATKGAQGQPTVFSLEDYSKQTVEHFNDYLWERVLPRKLKPDAWNELFDLAHFTGAEELEEHLFEEIERQFSIDIAFEYLNLPTGPIDAKMVVNPAFTKLQEKAAIYLARHFSEIKKEMLGQLHPSMLALILNQRPLSIDNEMLLLLKLLKIAQQNGRSKEEAEAFLTTPLPESNRSLLEEIHFEYLYFIDQALAAGLPEQGLELFIKMHQENWDKRPPRAAYCCQSYYMSDREGKYQVEIKFTLIDLKKQLSEGKKDSWQLVRDDTFKDVNLSMGLKIDRKRKKLIYFVKSDAPLKVATTSQLALNFTHAPNADEAERPQMGNLYSREQAARKTFDFTCSIDFENLLPYYRGDDLELSLYVTLDCPPR